MEDKGTWELENIICQNFRNISKRKYKTLYERKD